MTDVGFHICIFHVKNIYGIGIKTVSPGGIKTDFAGRSIVLTSHEAYTEQLNSVMAAFGDPANQSRYSTAEQIAEVVYEAATDGKKQLRYTAGEDAKATYARRLEVGDERFREGVQERFLGEK